MSQVQKQKRAIFLDRDGVINKKMPEGDYVKNWQEFEFLPGVVDALRFLTQKGYEIFVITNQRGVALGRMSKEEVEDIHRRMCEELRNNGAEIKAVYYCPHDYNQCECRKPAPGMLIQAAQDHNLDLAQAVFIGDDEKDMEAARRAGCRGLMVNVDQTLFSITKKLV